MILATEVKTMSELAMTHKAKSMILVSFGGWS